MFVAALCTLCNTLVHYKKSRKCRTPCSTCSFLPACCTNKRTHKQHVNICINSVAIQDKYMTVSQPVCSVVKSM